MAVVVMNKVLLSLTAALLLSACGSGQPQPPLSEAPLAGMQLGGDFNLTDQTGKKRTNAEFKGKWRIVYFGYTSCPDVCTPDMQNLMGGLKLFTAQEPALAAKIQPIFITVDPKRDTPAVLSQFVRAFHNDLIGLTGSEAEIAAAAKEYAVIYSVEDGGKGDSYLVSHMQLPYLIDPDGNPIAVLPVNGPGSGAGAGRPENVANELAKWVR